MTRREWIIVLVIVWLLAVPTSIGLGRTAQTITDNATASNRDATSAVFDPNALTDGSLDEPRPIAVPILNILSILFILYAVIGWVPPLIIGLRKGRKN